MARKCIYGLAILGAFVLAASIRAQSTQEKLNVPAMQDVTGLPAPPSVVLPGGVGELDGRTHYLKMDTDGNVYARCVNR